MVSARVLKFVGCIWYACFVCVCFFFLLYFFFFQAEDGIRDLVRSRGLGDVYKRQVVGIVSTLILSKMKNGKSEGFLFHWAYWSGVPTFQLTGSPHGTTREMME